MRTHDVDFEVDTKGHLVGRITDTTPSKFELSDVVPWSALLMSALSIGLTITTIGLTYHNNKLSVAPHLTLGVNSKHYPPMGIWLRNTGVGPAIIKSIEIRMDGHVIKNIESLRDIYATPSSLSKGSLVFREVIDGDFYSVNEKQDMLIQAQNITDDKILDKIWDKIYSNTEIRIKYCSAYNECQHVCLDALPETCNSAIEIIDKSTLPDRSSPK